MSQSHDLHAAFTDVRLWVFDLDNTLYPRPAKLWDEIDRRMTAFVSDALEVDRIEGRRIQKDYLNRYGVTLKGLMLHHGVEPRAFLDDVHDVDLSEIAPNPALGAAIAALPGRKIIHTNSARNHADRVLDRLDFSGDLFDAIHDIESTAYQAKPAPAAFDAVLGTEAAPALNAAMFEDAARNLLEPHRRGMRTIWTPTDCDWASHGSEGEHIHFVAEDITDFVSELSEALA